MYSTEHYDEAIKVRNELDTEMIFDETSVEPFGHGMEFTGQISDGENPIDARDRVIKAYEAAGFEVYDTGMIAIITVTVRKADHGTMTLDL